MKVPRDGVVCLFSVRNDSSDRDIDYDEVVDHGIMGRRLPDRGLLIYRK